MSKPKRTSTKAAAPAPVMTEVETDLVSEEGEVDAAEVTAAGGKNSNLAAAKSAKNDEFYTQWADIEREMNAYIEYNPDVFRDKVVLLPCDDPEWSNFAKFFALHFTDYGLKKLISTSYAADSKPASIAYQPTLFETEAPQYDEARTRTNGKMFVLDREDITGDGVINIDDLQWSYLDGDGDFRSAEVTALRNEADIVITNPPFSLFREFLAWLVAGDVRFAVVGNTNATTYKEVFPLIQGNKLWKGATANNTDMVFGVPKGTAVKEADKAKAKKLGYPSDDGYDYTRLGNSCWFTNIDHGRRHEALQLMTMADNRKFSKHENIKTNGYAKYDNYDAIEVPYVDAIPSDYTGVMGVPISFLDKYNPDQFEILGATQRGCHDLVPDTKKYDDYQEMRPDGTATGSKGGKTNENANLAGNDGKKNYFINKKGHVVQSAYQRLFIRHRWDSK